MADRPSAREVDCPVYLHSAKDKSADQPQKERIPALSPSTKAHLLGKEVGHSDDHEDAPANPEASSHKRHHKSSRRKGTTSEHRADATTHKRSSKGDRSPSRRKHRTRDPAKREQAKHVENEAPVGSSEPESSPTDTKKARKKDGTSSKTKQKSSRRSSMEESNVGTTSPSRRSRKIDSTTEESNTATHESTKHRSRRSDHSPSHKHRSRKESSSKGHEKRKADDGIKSGEETVPSGSSRRERPPNATSNVQPIDLAEVGLPNSGESSSSKQQRHSGKPSREQSISSPDQQRSPRRERPSKQHQDDAIAKIGAEERKASTTAPLPETATDLGQAPSHRSKADRSRISRIAESESDKRTDAKQGNASTTSPLTETATAVDKAPSRRSKADRNRTSRNPESESNKRTDAKQGNASTTAPLPDTATDVEQAPSHRSKADRSRASRNAESGSDKRISAKEGIASTTAPLPETATDVEQAPSYRSKADRSRTSRNSVSESDKRMEAKEGNASTTAPIPATATDVEQAPSHRSKADRSRTSRDAESESDKRISDKEGIASTAAPLPETATDVEQAPYRSKADRSRTSRNSVSESDKRMEAKEGNASTTAPIPATATDVEQAPSHRSKADRSRTSRNAVSESDKRTDTKEGIAPTTAPLPETATDVEQAPSHRSKADRSSTSRNVKSESDKRGDGRPRRKHRSRQENDEEPKGDETLSQAIDSGRDMSISQERSPQQSPSRRKHKRSEGSRDTSNQPCDKVIPGSFSGSIPITDEKSPGSIRCAARMHNDGTISQGKQHPVTLGLGHESHSHPGNLSPIDFDRSESRTKPSEESNQIPKPMGIVTTSRSNGESIGIVEKDKSIDESVAADRRVHDARSSVGAGDDTLPPNQDKENHSPSSDQCKLPSQNFSESQYLAETNNESPSTSNRRSNPLEKAANDNNAKAYGGFTAELKDSERMLVRSSSLRPTIPRSKSGCEIVAAASSMRGQLHRSKSLILRRQSSNDRLDGSSHRSIKTKQSSKKSELKHMKPILETNVEASTRTRTQGSAKIRKSTCRRRKAFFESGKVGDVASTPKPRARVNEAARKSPSCRSRKLGARLRRTGRIRAADDASVTSRLNEDADKFSICW